MLLDPPPKSYASSPHREPTSLPCILTRAKPAFLPTGSVETVVVPAKPPVIPSKCVVPSKPVSVPTESVSVPTKSAIVPARSVETVVVVSPAKVVSLPAISAVSRIEATLALKRRVARCRSWLEARWLRRVETS